MLLFLVALLTLVLVVALLLLGLRGSHGHLPSLLRGQVDPNPKHLQRDISVSGGVQPARAVQVRLDLDRPVAEVSQRYLSFAIDLSQVVGGKWWDPQAKRAEWGSGTVQAPLFDLDRPVLDRWVQGLAPAYLRIGGSEADKVYYHLEARSGTGTHLDVPPRYKSVLTRSQWDAIGAFAGRNGLELVYTLNAGPASRDRHGFWWGENAATLLGYTAAQGYPVSVWELGNELNIFFAVHGPSAQVPVAQYARDLRVARRLVDGYTPGARLAGQGSAFWPVLGEPLGLLSGYMPDYLKLAGDIVDVVTWHYYPQQSRRGPAASRRAHPSRLLDPRNLDEAAHWADKIQRWRDRYAPGRPVWLGETGHAQFGGEPGLSDTFLSGLWWLDQLGLLARLGHDVVVRQTLAGLDYGLLDADTLNPRPDYWHSLLWKRLMGRQVYAAGAEGEGAQRLRVYAHGAAFGPPGAVVALAINLDPEQSAAVSFPDFEGCDYKLYTVTAPDVLGQAVLLNGAELVSYEDGVRLEIRGARQAPVGVPVVPVPPLSYAFLVLG